MIKTLVITGFLVVLIKAQELIEFREECVCVPISQCTGFREGEVIIDFHKLAGHTDVECGSSLMTCCYKNNIIPEESRIPTRVPDGCGFRNVNGVGFKLINGNVETQFAEFPWMIEILIEAPLATRLSKPSYTYLAGGSLVHPSFVLTSARQMHNKDNRKMKIRAGEWNVNKEDEPYPYQERRIARIIIHEDFDFVHGYSDVALLFLNSQVNVRSHINTVCIPPQNLKFPENTPCFVTGWEMNAGLDTTDIEVLKKADVTIVSDQMCQRSLRNTSLGENYHLHYSMICGGSEAGKNPCTGGSGSPLVCPMPNTVNRYYQAGIVIGGVGCEQEHIPSLYVDVSFFHDWIISKIF